jgi:hypothetical protein
MRTKIALAAAVVALSLPTAGTGVALAQAHDDDHGGATDPELAEKCGSYNFIEWLLFHHECHGHTTGIVYWPKLW